MSEVLDRVVDPLTAVAGLHAALDQLAAVQLTGLSDEDMLQYARDKERAIRRLAAADHDWILEAQARRLPDSCSVRGMASLLRMLLRLDPREAAGRVRAAEAAGTRHTLTGQPLPAIYPAVAAAQRAGDLSPRQAAVIIDGLEKLPDTVRAEHGTDLEHTLVRHAAQFDPVPLARLVQRIHDHYQPDGTPPDPDLDDPDSDRGGAAAAHRARLRELSLAVRPDGSASLKGELTAEATALLQVHLDALAAPTPERDGVKDPRTARQRRHDALVAMLKLVLRSDQLPTIAGVTATVVVTMTLEQYQTGTGLARTAHGTLIPTRDAFTTAGGDYRVLAVALSTLKGVEAYSATHRTFTENQRLALHALDGGCTFPHCTAPPGWCQVHHLKPWSQGGATSLDNATLVCSYDHTHRIAQGWSATRINGRTAWTPPTWIDPTRTPRDNHHHLPWRALEANDPALPGDEDRP
jgi:Domain of unknown function (DUF222)/HNH endonuclease